MRYNLHMPITPASEAPAGRNLEHMPHPDWLLDFIAKNPTTAHGDYVIHHGFERPEYPYVEAMSHSGEKVGRVEYAPVYDYQASDEPGVPPIEMREDPPAGWQWHPGSFWKKLRGYKVWDAQVHPEHRRKGIATAMYDHAAKHLGAPTFPGDVQTDDGAAFRASLKKSDSSDNRPQTAAHIGHPEFKSWFGDSKAVTPDGKPMRLYHGTTSPEPFTTFNIGTPRGVENKYGETEWEHGSGGDPSAYVGAHFAEEPHVANKFTKPIYGRYRNEHGRVYPVHIRAVNPKHYESEEDFQRDLYRVHSNHNAVDDYLMSPTMSDEEDPDEAGQKYDSDPEYREQINRQVMEELGRSDDSDEALHFASDLAAEHRRALQAQGHDSIRYRNDVEGGGYSWAVFEPHQVKSAIGNAGTFSALDDSIIKSEGWLALDKAEQTKFPFLIGADEAPRYKFHFKLDKPEDLHHRYRPISGYVEVRHQGEPVGVLSFDQDGSSGSFANNHDAVHVGYVGVHPEHRGRGLGSVMLGRFRSWMNHHRPHVHFMQSEVTNRGALKLLGRHYGDPLYLADAIRDYSVPQGMKWLPERAEEDGEKIPQGWNGIDGGGYLHAVHWIGQGNRPVAHPWGEQVQKSLKDDVRDRVLAKMGKLTKNLSRLPMPFARPHFHLSWPIGATDWRKQKVKVEHRDGAGGQPTGAGWVQVQDGQVLSQDGHAVSARNPGAR
jgi:ribosomal protein S18 acetylase RimI-like enzyme